MSNEWNRPVQSPPPLFVGEKEKNLVKQVNDEIIEESCRPTSFIFCY